MARKQLLDPELVHILSTRIHISRQLGIFTLKTILDNWTISKATMYRYHSPELREDSRERNRKAYLEYKERLEELKGKCWKCKKSYSTHKRCIDCTCLLHQDSPICLSCNDTRHRKMMREYDPDVVDLTDLFNLPL